MYGNSVENRKTKITSECESTECTDAAAEICPGLTASLAGLSPGF